MNNKVKRFISYLVYVVAFGYLAIKFDDLYRYFKDIFLSTYRPPYLWVCMVPIFEMLIGVLLALPQFIRTYRQEGSWKIDWIILLTVGLPAFCIAIAQIAQYISISWQPAASILMYLPYYPTTVKVAGILFGFTLITSFSKQES